MTWIEIGWIAMSAAGSASYPPTLMFGMRAVVCSGAAPWASMPRQLDEEEIP